MLYRGTEENDVVVLDFLYNNQRVDVPAKLIAIDVSSSPRKGWSSVAIDKIIVHVRPDQVVDITKYFEMRTAGKLSGEAVGRLSFEDDTRKIIK